MIDDPVQVVERYVAVHFLEHVERPRDRLVVCSVHPPRPAVLRKHANNCLEITFHVRRHVGALDPEILEIGCAVDQHLAAAIVTVHIVALRGFELLGPRRKILQFLLRFLGK